MESRRRPRRFANTPRPSEVASSHGSWPTRSILLAGFLCLLAGCTSYRLSSPGAHPNVLPSPSLTAEQQAKVQHSCFDGLPQKASRKLGPTEFVFREGYVLEFSSVAKIPLWVCETVSSAQLGGAYHREGRFRSDPDLKGPKSQSGDYANSGYDRGHQAPAGDQTQNREQNAATFFMSNIAPQTPTLNEGIWEKLENRVRHWAREYGQVYVFTGPVFFDQVSGEWNPSALTRPAHTIGGDAVAVPTHFYKIVLARTQADGQWRAIAFVLPNTDYARPYLPENYRSTIQWIENHTGIRFIPEAVASERRRLETATSQMWP